MVGCGDGEDDDLLLIGLWMLIEMINGSYIGVLNDFG